MKRRSSPRNEGKRDEKAKESTTRDGLRSRKSQELNNAEEDTPHRRKPMMPSSLEDRKEQSGDMLTSEEAALEDHRETDTKSPLNKSEKSEEKPEAEKEKAEAQDGKREDMTKTEGDENKTPDGNDVADAKPKAEGEDKPKVKEDGDDEVEADVPVKEIHMTPQGEHKHHHHHHNAPKYLHEETIQAIKKYLAEKYPCDNLNDDEVVAFLLRMERLATHQTDYQQRLVGIASDESDASLFDEILLEEEEHALGKEFFTNMITAIEKQTSLTLDKKTLAWIKRAAGLHRSRSDVPKDVVDDEAVPGTRRSERRYTRGMARTTRNKKRERGLNILMSVVGELEEDYGPFPAKPIQRKRSLSPYQADDEMAGRRRKENSSPSRPSKRLAREEKADKKRERDRDQFYQRKKRDDSEEPTGKRRRTQPRRTKPTDEADAEEGPVSLRLLDWQRRMNLPYKAYQTDWDSEGPPLPKSGKGLPSAFSNGGFAYRLPPWHVVNPAASPFEQYDIFDPPRSRHSDQVYASFTSKLVNFLRGDGRSWATHEFFYSDLDRAWYNRNEFAEAVAKLGMRPGTKLTRREWRAVRRRLSNKPRRFSKSFIASQLSERNKYRASVRAFQRNPDLATRLNFEYDVPATMQVGTTVTAYSRTYRILQRGTVLSYDERNARYLVQFEIRQFGHEFCPDTEVASHGPPQLLIPAPERELDGGGYLNMPRLSGKSFDVAVTGPKGKSNWEVVDELASALKFKPLQLETSKASSHWSASAIPVRSKRSKAAKRSLDEEVAEHESLVTLMAIIEASLTRKKMLLDAIEKVHTIMVQHLPFGEDPSTVCKTSQKVDQHYTWLLANLETTNQVTDTALGYLRTLYGKAYLAQRSEGFTTKLQFITNAVGHIMSDRSPSLPPMATTWIARVLTDAEDVGKAITTSFRPAAENGGRDARSLYLKERLASVGALALTSSCCQQLPPKSPAAADSTFTATAMAAAASNLSKPNLPPAPEQGLYAEMVAARNLAIEDLNEAVDLLNAELAASSVQPSN